MSSIVSKPWWPPGTSITDTAPAGRVGQLSAGSRDAPAGPLLDVDAHHRGSDSRLCRRLREPGSDGADVGCVVTQLVQRLPDEPAGGPLLPR